MPLNLFMATFDVCQEGETGVINLPDDDPDAIKIMVQHVYGKRLKTCKTTIKDNCDDCRARLSLEVYAVADKYLIPSLAVSARNEFKAWAATEMGTKPGRASWMRSGKDMDILASILPSRR
ncbi:BTB/POZ domain protein [Penicillium waksmanii]|uniref:BTB/POZ domain protein n=1 Tax=Penicillium waksmanii TaxID=69791 RepID=UPI002546815F|nr:BTB/POZ domain protein [Penicillium waksmanii]KAJ6000788.1 BTB/POZ domain protein [Penicillium waksmanii]